MEVCVPCNSSAYLDISSSCGSSPDPHQYNSRDLSMNDLETCLTELLNIEDIAISTSDFNKSSGKNDTDNVVTENEGKNPDKITPGNSVHEKCSLKCAASPPHSGPKSSGDVYLSKKEKHGEDKNVELSEVNGSAKPFNQCFSRSISLPVNGSEVTSVVSETNGSSIPSNQCCSRSISLPTPSKLVSALKGSREKQGMPTKKLSVSWAPDVYDPIPTSVSHVPSSKNLRYRGDGKKYGKYKQKGSSGKSSRGSSKSKDKKQGRKNGGRSSSKPKSFLEDSGVISFGEPQFCTVDIDVGSPDQFCGSSFLKKSVTNMHFSVAEAK